MSLLGGRVVLPASASAPAPSPMSDECGTELVLLLNAEGLLQQLAFTERR